MHTHIYPLSIHCRGRPGRPTGARRDRSTHQSEIYRADAYSRQNHRRDLRQGQVSAMSDMCWILTRLAELLFLWFSGGAYLGIEWFIVKPWSFSMQILFSAPHHDHFIHTLTTESVCCHTLIHIYTHVHVYTHTHSMYAASPVRTWRRSTSCSTTPSPLRRCWLRTMGTCSKYCIR